MATAAPRQRVVVTGLGDLLHCAWQIRPAYKPLPSPTAARGLQERQQPHRAADGPSSGQPSSSRSPSQAGLHFTLASDGSSHGGLLVVGDRG